MKLDKLKDCRVLCFAAGAVVIPVIKKVVKCEKTRRLCVTGLAKGMKLYQDAQEAVKNIREDAEDICYEARNSLDEEEEAGPDEI